MKRAGLALLLLSITACGGGSSGSSRDFGGFPAAPAAWFTERNANEFTGTMLAGSDNWVGTWPWPFDTVIISCDEATGSIGYITDPDKHHYLLSGEVTEQNPLSFFSGNGVELAQTPSTIAAEQEWANEMGRLCPGT